MNKTYSLHKVDKFGVFSFNPDDYSRFKFGDNSVAKAFGAELAQGFIQDQLALNPIQQQIVVVSSPYSFIPTATFYMKNEFVAVLNRWLVQQQLPVVQETKIHRNTTYRDDYGELSAEERFKLIGRDRFQVDREFLEGKTVLFLDDIRITGMHEKMILQMIQNYQLKNDYRLLYYAELTNPEINPKIENYLNYHYVRSISDLGSIVEENAFVFNTRVVKYILNYAPIPCATFLKKQSSAFINQLYDLALGNNYHTIEAYQPNLNFIRTQLQVSNTSKQLYYGN